MIDDGDDGATHLLLAFSGLHSAIDHSGGMAVGRWGSIWQWIWVVE